MSLQAALPRCIAPSWSNCWDSSIARKLPPRTSPARTGTFPCSDRTPRGCCTQKDGGPSRRRWQHPTRPSPWDRTEASSRHPSSLQSIRRLSTEGCICRDQNTYCGREHIGRPDRSASRTRRTGCRQGLTARGTASRGWRKERSRVKAAAAW